MKLIEYDGQDFKVADEAFLVRPIRDLYRADKSKKKELFWRQLSYIWFMCDPRSSYMYLTDEKERASEVKNQEGFGDDWKPSATLLEAMEVYRRQSITTASIFLDTMRQSIDDMSFTLRKLGAVMRTLNGTETAKDNGLTLDKALMTMKNIAKEIPEISKSFVEAEKAMAKDFSTEDNARGSAQKAIGEDV